MQRYSMTFNNRWFLTAASLVVLAALSFGSGDTDSSSSTSSTSDSGAAAPGTPAPEFVTLRREYCGKYKEASNDIKKSGVFEEYFTMAAAAGASVDGLAGTIGKIETPQGGDYVHVTVKTQYGSFNNNDALQSDTWDSPRKINKGTGLYSSFGALDEGTKVTFSGSMIVGEKNLFSEKLGVCGDDWLIKFTKVEVPAAEVPAAEVPAAE
jgi:hypothetical protein